MPAPSSSSEKNAFKPSPANVLARTMPSTCYPRSMIQNTSPASSILLGGCFPLSLLRNNWMLPSSFTESTQLLTSRLHKCKLSKLLEILEDLLERFYPYPLPNHDGPTRRVRDWAGPTLYGRANSPLSLIKRISSNIPTCDEGIVARIETFLTKTCAENPRPYHPISTGDLYPYCNLQNLNVASSHYEAALEARNCGCQVCATLSKLLVFTTFVEAYTRSSLAEA